ncbi:hypothetical protein AURDEDRAFT_117350 [Auricularia subglabra TFB-10046 SS5]|uniref:Uncharacterized protein n=1 Tax=Auricularia subglabra (strain TFB-10046 / SS5) TaxID=717982 RepID=J0CXN0_AURST|nr:hypothetical protein AURDEDRAFT_117350 [Auricularia subglabra TFB-10046 SS5]
MRNLRSLCVISDGGTRDSSWKFLDIALGADGEAHAPIEDLSLSFREYADKDGSHRTLYRLLKRAAPTLRRLHLGLHLGANDTAAPFIAGLAEALQLAPRLQVLSFQTRNAPPGCHIPLLEALPCTLRSLSFGQSFFPPHAMPRDASWEKSLDGAQAILKRVDQGALPALRELTMGADRQSTMLANKKTDPSRNLPERKANERRQKQLVKDAAKLGVALEVLDEELADHLPWFYVNSR